MFKKIISLILVLIMATSFAVLADEGEWEKSTFSSWSQYNIYAGKDELNNISTKLDKSNLAYMIAESFDLRQVGEVIDIKDVKESDWAYKYIQIVVSHNILSLQDGYFFPNEFISREQIPEALSFIPTNMPRLSEKNYMDIDEISPQYDIKMRKFVEAGYTSDISSDYLFPQRIATIADFITIIDKMFPNVSNGIIKGETYDGNFILKEKMSYLESVTINGDMIITQGAMQDNFVKGNFKISLVNVKVNGTIYIYGGNLFGSYVLDGVEADKIIVITESPIIFNIQNSMIDSIENNSKNANFITNMNLNITKNTGDIIFTKENSLNNGKTIDKVV